MMYKDVKEPEIIRGLKYWKNKGNLFNVLMLHYTADPNKDSQRKGVEWYRNERKGTLKVLWQKEYEIDFTTKSGKLIFSKDFCDFDINKHLIISRDLPEPYEYLISLDFGQRNPTCALVGIWTTGNRLYIIDEYYRAALPSISSRDMFKKFAYILGDTSKMSINEKRSRAIDIFHIRVIDPKTSSKNRSKQTGTEEIEYSVKEEFDDHGWDFDLGSNAVSPGINRIREYMQFDDSGEPHLYIFKDKCPNLVRQLQNYRYKEYTDATGKTRNESEEPIKKDDHACVAGNSLVNTVNGDIPIKNLVGKTGYVYSYNEKEKRITAKKYKNVIKTGTKKTIKLTLDDNSELIITPDHPIMLRGGDYIEAGELKEGDSLMPFYRTIDSRGHLTIRLNNGNKIFAHRLVYQDCVGKLPEDSWTWNIHHINQDKLNNNPDNLQLLTRADHCRLHAKNREITDETKIKLRAASTKKQLDKKYRAKQKINWKRFVEDAKKWHASEEGIVWHKENGKNCWSEKNRERRRKMKKCLWCGNEFITEDGTGKYCHNNCKAKYNRKKREEKFGMIDFRRAKLKKEGIYNHKIIKIEDYKIQDVYNMEVEDTHNFACEGIIVHNCDSLRYMVMTRPTTPQEPEIVKTRIQKDIEGLIRPKIISHDWDAN